MNGDKTLRRFCAKSYDHLPLYSHFQPRKIFPRLFFKSVREKTNFSKPYVKEPTEFIKSHDFSIFSFTSGLNQKLSIFSLRISKMNIMSKNYVSEIAELRDLYDLSLERSKSLLRKFLIL